MATTTLALVMGHYWIAVIAGWAGTTNITTMKEVWARQPSGLVRSGMLSYTSG